MKFGAAAISYLWMSVACRDIKPVKAIDVPSNVDDEKSKPKDPCLYFGTNHRQCELGDDIVIQRKDASGQWVNVRPSCYYIGSKHRICEVGDEAVVERKVNDNWETNYKLDDVMKTLDEVKQTLGKVTTTTAGRRALNGSGKEGKGGKKEYPDPSCIFFGGSNTHRICSFGTELVAQSLSGGVWSTFNNLSSQPSICYRDSAQLFSVGASDGGDDYDFDSELATVDFGSVSVTGVQDIIVEATASTVLFTYTQVANEPFRRNLVDNFAATQQLILMKPMLTPINGGNDVTAQPDVALPLAASLTVIDRYADDPEAEIKVDGSAGTTMGKFLFRSGDLSKGVYNLKFLFYADVSAGGEMFSFAEGEVTLGPHMIEVRKVNAKRDGVCATSYITDSETARAQFGDPGFIADVLDDLDGFFP